MQIGELVCDCRFIHQRIAEIDEDGDTVTLEDGHVCSYEHCCDPADHTWRHPIGAGWPAAHDAELPDELIERYAAEAERGYDPAQLRPRRPT